MMDRSSTNLPKASTSDTNLLSTLLFWYGSFTASTMAPFFMASSFCCCFSCSVSTMGVMMGAGMGVCFDPSGLEDSSSSSEDCWRVRLGPVINPRWEEGGWLMVVPWGGREAGREDWFRAMAGEDVDCRGSGFWGGRE